MSTSTRRFAFALAPLVFVGCLHTHTEPDPSLDVAAEIASVTLADDCASSTDGRMEPGLIAGDCAEDGCPSFCQQTGVRLTLDAALEGASSVPFEVLSIRLFHMDGELADELDPHAAQLFRDGAYESWDETVRPGDSLHVTYDTSAPNWADIGDGNAWSTHGMSFRVEMTVRIDGVERTLEFSPASRESEIVT